MENRLDVLVNNAAMLLEPYNRTVDDLQDIMVINHISPFVLTRELLPCMKKTAAEEGSDVRIVNVSSDAIQYQKPGMRFRNKEDLNEEHADMTWPQFCRYGRSKLANVLFTKELQRRFDADNVPIIAVSLHPGTVNADGNQNFIPRMGPILGYLYGIFSALYMDTTEIGSYTSVFAAAAPIIRAEPDRYKAAYLHPVGKIAIPGQDALTEGLPAELWETTERILEEIDV